MVELLLSKGADINAQHGTYGHALYAAACNGDQSMVELLLAKGADVNAEYVTYGTALHIAILNRHGRVVRLLIKDGANVNAISDWGTPLHLALSRGDSDLVDLLKAAGALDDDESITPSTEAGHVEMSGSGEMG